MAGKPQRERPKQSIQMRVDSGVYVSVLPLLCNGVMRFSSISQLIETIIFLSECMYAEEPDNEFVIKLVNLKFQRVLEKIRGCEERLQAVHLTLDPQAVSFVDMLAYRYDRAFRNRNEVLELLLLNVGKSCETDTGVRYYGGRLRDVSKLHPMRSDGLLAV